MPGNARWRATAQPRREVRACSGARSAFAWMFAVTMVLEMAPILVQAARGTLSHFLALHALQLFPLLAWGLVQLALPGWMRWAALGSAVAATSALCVGTLVQALAGRPFLPGGG